MGLWLSGRSGMCRWTLADVRDGSGDTPGGLRRFVDYQVGPGRVGRPSVRSWMGQETLEEVRDGSWDTRGGAGRVGEILE